MNEQTGLPFEFKMLMDGVVVGYERHEIIDGEITILHSKDDNGWWPIACIEKKIPHDEKFQYTGFKIKNRKVYFGDKLKDGNGPWNILKVEMSEDGEIVAANNMFGCFAKDFKIMELTNDTP